MKEITLKAVPENIARVTELVDSELEKLGCAMKPQMQLDVAIDELFSNIALYAYAPDTGEATVRFEFDEETQMAAVTFMDHGKEFNPLLKEDPDTHISAVERVVGGLGIFLVKKTMDQMEYSRCDGMNILTIRKRIS